MNSDTSETGDDRHRHVSQMDEMSLADELAAETPESAPDTLEVRDDSMAIVQGTLNDLRRPFLIVAAVAGAAALVAVGLMVLSRAADRGTPLLSP